VPIWLLDGVSDPPCDCSGIFADMLKLPYEIS
jgi:hypothetical protein